MRIKPEIKKELELSDNDVQMNSPKPTKAALIVNNELNMSVDEHDQHNEILAVNNELNMSVDEASLPKVTTPVVKKTPKLPHTPSTPDRNNVRVITEELLISPDSSRPVITTEPKSSSSNLITKNLVLQPGFASRLNSTILSNLTDTPDSNTSTKSSVSSSESHSPGRLCQTFVQDSPAQRVNQSTSGKRLVVEDSPEKSPDDSSDHDRSLDQSVRMDASLLVDSVLEESEMQDNTEDSDTGHSGEKSHITSTSLNSSSKYNSKHGEIINNSSVKYTNEFSGINSPVQAKPGIESKSFIENIDDSKYKEMGAMGSNLLPEEELPDLDSPVQARSGIRSRSFKKHVIESSDEHSDDDNGDKCTDEDIVMDHSGSDIENNVNNFISEEAAVNSDSEVQEGDNDSAESVHDSEAASDEEEEESESSGEEEEEEEEEVNGLQGRYRNIKPCLAK